MNQKRLIRIALILILAVIGYFQKDRFTGGKSPSNPRSPVPISAVDSNKTIVKNVEIRDMDGSVAYRGDVDLRPEIQRIRSGKKDRHENDGSVFGNFEGKLPRKSRGYYREYVVRTPGIRHSGPQRLIIGKSGEIYYTPNHYQSFRKISP